MPFQYSKQFNQLLIFCVILILSTSCNDTLITQTGFKATFNENSSGISIIEIKQEMQKVYLNGKVTVNSGELEIQVFDGNDDICYQRLISNSDTVITINEIIQGNSGYWKLKYKSYNAHGEINLRLKF
jgi:hypothetical protein